MSLTLTSKPTFIEWKNLRFLIMDAPKESNLHLYLKECEKHHVTTLVRISEPTYDKAEVEKAGISLHVIMNLLLVKLILTDSLSGNVFRRWR